MSRSTDSLALITQRIREFARERQWDRFHDPKNLAMLLASEVGELLAEYRWIPNDHSREHTLDAEARRRVANEIGDVGIALLMLCDAAGVDLRTAIDEKLDLNAANYPLEQSRGRPDRP